MIKIYQNLFNLWVRSKNLAFKDVALALSEQKTSKKPNLTCLKMISNTFQGSSIHIEVKKLGNFFNPQVDKYFHKNKYEIKWILAYSSTTLFACCLQNLTIGDAITFYNQWLALWKDSTITVRSSLIFSLKNNFRCAVNLVLFVTLYIAYVGECYVCYFCHQRAFHRFRSCWFANRMVDLTIICFSRGGVFSLRKSVVFEYQHKRIL